MYATAGKDGMTLTILITDQNLRHRSYNVPNADSALQYKKKKYFPSL